MRRLVTFALALAMIAMVSVTSAGTKPMVSARSFAVSFYTLDAIVVKMEQQYKADKWTTTNDDQRDLLKEAAETAKNDDLYSIPELKVQIGSAKRVNHFLCANGIKQMLPEHTNTSAVSIIDLKTEWFYLSGLDAVIAKQGRKYPAVMMTIRPMIWDSEASPLPIVEILGPWRNPHTPDEYRDDVFMAETDQPIKTAQELVDRVGELIHAKRTNSKQSYATVIFPKVSLDYTSPVGEMHGMELRGPDSSKHIIGQARDYIRFRMDEKGQPGKPIAKPAGWSLVIDRPFILWVERSSLQYPLMAAYIMPDAWRKP